MAEFSINKKGILTKYNGKGGDVVVPDRVTGIGEKAFYGCYDLKSIVLPKGITSIGDSAFVGCGLTSIVLPDGLEHIGNHVFERNFALESILLPENVSSIGKWIFPNSGSRLKLVASADSGYDFSNGALPEKRELHMSTLEYHMRWGISGDALEGCELYIRGEHITDLVIPAGITVIPQNAYAHYHSLTSVTLPEGLTGIESYAFSGCKKLRAVELPEGISFIGESAFSFCKSLTAVTLPKSIVSIGDDVFRYCDNLTDITTGTKLTTQMFGQKPKWQSKEQYYRPLNVNDIGMLPVNMKPYAAIGFAENPDDLQSTRGKGHIKYIKSNAAKLVEFAFKHISLLRLMLDNKLLTPEVTEIYFAAAQESGNTEAIAMILDYQHGKLTAAEKEKAARKAEEREDKVIGFVFGVDAMEQLQGKVFVVTGKLKSFSSRDEFKACLDACGAILSETLNDQTDYLITNTPDSGSAKNKKAAQLGIKKLTEDAFNRMIGRAVPQ